MKHTKEAPKGCLTNSVICKKILFFFVPKITLSFLQFCNLNHSYSLFGEISNNNQLQSTFVINFILWVDNLLSVVLVHHCILQCERKAYPVRPLVYVCCGNCPHYPSLEMPPPKHHTYLFSVQADYCTRVGRYDAIIAKAHRCRKTTGQTWCKQLLYGNLIYHGQEVTLAKLSIKDANTDWFGSGTSFVQLREVPDLTGFTVTKIKLRK